MRFDGKKPIEFTDETVKLEQDNLEETKYVLKGSAPSSDSSIGDEDPLAGLEDAPEEDMGLEDAPEGGNDKPFDDEPFDADVEADEDTDPKKYIQQLSGKLGQSLRQYTEDEGQPDYDLEKFAVNSVLSATHTSDMDKEDQRDIINKVKSSGDEDDSDEVDSDVEADMDVDKDIDSGEEDIDFNGEEPVEEVEELPIGGVGTIELKSTVDPEAVEIMKGMATGCELDEVDSKFGEDKRFGNDKRFSENVEESEKNSIFTNKSEILKELRFMENTEPMVEPLTKPDVKPSRPMRETDRPFLPKRKDKVKPDPKAENNGMLTDDINE